ncbi:MAG: OmpA family protein [Chitinophagaceae bacterium]|nr:OmpA family protein [Chitinophagaceae bacterium]MDB5223063.1 OmpA family protein [Chitinophagaceae bacterium]
MKKLILPFFIIALCASSFAQKADNRKRSTLGINFFLSDFQTAADIKKNGLGSVIRNKNFFKTGRMNPGLSLSYLKGLANHVDFTGTLGGSFVDYPIANLPRFGSNLLLEATAGVNVKLLSDKYWVVPFADFGVGASKYLSHFAAFLPVGAGVQISLFDEAFIIINSQYRFAVTDQATSHLYHSIGIAGNIGKDRQVAPKEVIIPVVVPPSDRDSDGIVDSLDACPDQAGPASLNGCPDRDSDGIADKDDNCPDVAGLARYHGCPIPDRDKDGINDEEDKCPDVAGVARYQGCPIPDTDNDGVNDEEDKCPNEAGPASNFGCPVIAPEVIEKVNLAARNIFFATGSSKLLAKSYSSLDNVVKILQDNPSYKVDIAGHTDTTGTQEKNHVLSHDRANAVKAYLVSKGIDESRMTTEGYGSDRPIASNKTAAGKAKNRRVEMKLSNY